MGKMGMIDYFRLPLRTWYWYRNELRGIAPPEWPEPGRPERLELTASGMVIGDISGRDDVHLTVAVLDAAGKRLSNDLTITLQIESGPGMFPSGRTIRFIPGSFIEMRDGKAAIEFKSFHAGESVIRATADGLEDAVITIVTIGACAYDEADPTSSRLYAATSQQTVGLRKTERPARDLAAQRPAMASSEAPGHSACAANNKKPDESWKAVADTSSQWWQLDMEGFYWIENIKLRVPDNARYEILLSPNSATWTRLDQQSRADRSRFLRVEFRQAPEIYDIEVWGTECDPIRSLGDLSHL
jgi:beta-galactosidase